MIKLKDILTELEVHSFGASPEDEKRAGKATMNYAMFGHSGLYKNSDAFKADIKKNYLKGDITKLSDKPVRIKGGSKAHLHFNTSGTFDKSNVDKIFAPVIKKFKAVNGKPLAITNFTDKSFTLTWQP